MANSDQLRLDFIRRLFGGANMPSAMSSQQQEYYPLGNLAQQEFGHGRQAAFQPAPQPSPSGVGQGIAQGAGSIFAGLQTRNQRQFPQAPTGSQISPTQGLMNLFGRQSGGLS